VLLNPYRFGAGPAPASLFITTDDIGNLYTSEDGGVTWTAQTMPAGMWSWGVTRNGGVFITVDAGLASPTTQGAATSSDHVTWADQTTPAQDDEYGWYGTATNGSRVVAIGQADNTQAAMYSDDDGETWTMGSCTGDIWRSILYAPELGLWIAQGTIGTQAIASSSNGSSFTRRNTTSGIFFGHAGAWNGSKYRCVGNNNSDGVATVLKSSNGTTYNTVSAGVAVGDGQWGATIWDGTQFVAIGYGFAADPGYSYIITSPDGDTWTQKSDKIPVECSALAFDGTQYLAIQIDGTSGAEVYATTDLDDAWTNVGTLPGTGYFVSGVKHFSG
jgi:hypothetical protein